MHSKKFTISLAILIVLFLQTVSATLMDTTNANQYLYDQGMLMREEENKCIRAYYASEYDIHNEDEYYRLTVNMINVAGNECSSDPCTKPCVTECCEVKGWCTLDCIADCEYECNKPKKENCEQQCSVYGDDLRARWEYQECVCVCPQGLLAVGSRCLTKEEADALNNPPTNPPNNGEGDSGDVVVVTPPADPPEEKCKEKEDCEKGEICKGGKCEKHKSNVPSKDDIRDKFDDDDLNPEEPDVPEMDALTKALISLRLGLDVDDFEPGMGEGKIAYVIISDEIGGYEKMWLGGKINSMIAFYDHLGYEVRVLDNRKIEDIEMLPSTQTFDAIANPKTGAVTFFGHGAEASIEHQDADGVATQLAQRRMHWYMKQGMSQSQARQKANSDLSMALDFFYNHSCHSADEGFKELADYLLKVGGRYYGEPGLLWATSHPDYEYIKK